MPNWWSRLIRQETTDRTMMWLGPSHGAPQPKPIEVGKKYVTLRVKSARIPYLRELATKYHLSVASWLDWQTEASGMQRGTSVIAPNDARDLPPKRGDRIAFVDMPVLRQVPWQGELAVKIALFAVVEENLANPVLDYLVKATETAGFGFAGPAKIYADLVKEASDAIFGTVGSSHVLTGMDRNFLASDLQEGFLLLSDAPATETKNAPMVFDPQDKRIKPKTDRDRDPLEGYAYMVLEFVADNDRRDWAQFEPLRNAWEELSRAYVDEKTTPAVMERLFGRYERMCRASPDLLPEDAKRKAAKARAKFAPVAAIAASEGFAPGHRPPLPKFEELA
jgi:hypothetical protein